jgi:hypothetical protein
MGHKDRQLRNTLAYLSGANDTKKRGFMKLSAGRFLMGIIFKQTD